MAKVEKGINILYKMHSVGIEGKKCMKKMRMKSSDCGNKFTIRRNCREKYNEVKPPFSSK